MTTRRTFTQIRFQLLTTLAGISVLFFLFIGSFYLNAKKAAIDNDLVEIERITAIGAEALNGSLFSINAGLTLIRDEIVRNPKLINSYPSKTLKSLQKLLPANSAIEFKVANADGTITSATDNTIGKSISERSYFIESKESNSEEMKMTEAIIGKFNGKKIINVRKRIVINQKFAGLVYAILNEDFFKINLEDLFKGQKNTIIIHSGPQMTESVTYPTENLKLEVGPKEDQRLSLLANGGLEKGAALGIATPDKVPRFWGVSWVGPYAMRLTVGTDYEAEMANWSKEISISISAILVIYLCFIFSVVFFLKKQEQIQAQQQLMATSSRLAALGEMSASMAHEINNPLAIITLNLGRIQKSLSTSGLDQKTTESLNKFVVQSEKNAERIMNIITSLRRFSREPEKDLHPTPVKVFVNDALGLCQERFKSHGVELSTACPEDLQVNGNTTQLTQVLVNLLNNAFDITSTLETKWIKLTCEASEGKVLIKVTDSGTGIAKENLSKIMEPFFTTKEIGKGTGLGLSISKGIVESHGGQIYYQLDQGHTSFVIELPQYV